MYEVVVYFDNMIDSVTTYENEAIAYAEADNLKWRYRTSRLYRVEVRKADEK
ncbi:Uncharacterised protein [Streptococcus pasteurianus]|jgi:hypothetical protein|uniref:DUF7204 family protein n=1 Tax=Streptococcus pasteurianus TaxID=197614 RepID=UPI001168D897|nr:hypothetical protein [Streptococcus pasteurianus]VUW91653.1 Uncharacterised protein [Streptococcus pasteurianus]